MARDAPCIRNDEPIVPEYSPWGLRAYGVSRGTSWECAECAVPVKAHLGSIFREIAVADRTSAALWAREHLD